MIANSFRYSRRGLAGVPQNAIPFPRKIFLGRTPLCPPSITPSPMVAPFFPFTVIYNPKLVEFVKATEGDFTRETHRVYRSQKHASRIGVRVLASP